MKISNLVLALTLSTGAIMAPVKKAEASLLIMNPAAIVLAGAGFLAWTLPALDSDNLGGLYERIFTPVFMTLGTMILLDQDLDKLEATLLKANPKIPSYVIAEATQLLLEKASRTEFNKEGLKSVALSEEEFLELEQVMVGDVEASDIALLKRMLTSDKALN